MLFGIVLLLCSVFSVSRMDGSALRNSSESLRAVHLLRVMSTGDQDDAGMQSCREMVAAMNGCCGLDDLGPLPDIIVPVLVSSSGLGRGCIARPARLIRFWAAIPTSEAHAAPNANENLTFGAVEYKLTEPARPQVVIDEVSPFMHEASSASGHGASSQEASHLVPSAPTEGKKNILALPGCRRVHN